MIAAAEVSAWLEQWQAAINANDVNAGRALFSDVVTSFGSYADRCDGLDRLVSDQWSNIWPVTKGFMFDMASMRTSASLCQHEVFIAVLWTSIGLIDEAVTYPRRGRATIVLSRSKDGRLLAIHTHFSMSQGYVARID